MCVRSRALIFGYVLCVIRVTLYYSSDVYCPTRYRVCPHKMILQEKEREGGSLVSVLHHQKVMYAVPNTMPPIIANNNYHNKIELSIYYRDQKPYNEPISWDAHTESKREREMERHQGIAKSACLNAFIKRSKAFEAHS